MVGRCFTKIDLILVLMVFASLRAILTIGEVNPQSLLVRCQQLFVLAEASIHTEMVFCGRLLLAGFFQGTLGFGCGIVAMAILPAVFAFEGRGASCLRTWLWNRIHHAVD